MFSHRIVASDAFLDMPVSSRELYFQLGMYADDDGFINPKKIIRMVGASDDDIKVLITRRFVLPFDNGVVVIKHWAINNLIRKDWYQETIYLEQKMMLKLKENGSYTESVNKPLTIRSHSIGKVSIGKVNSTASGDREIPEIIKLFEEVNPMIQKLYGSPPQRKAVERLLKEFGKEKLTIMIAALPKINGQQYWPKSTTPVQLENNIAVYMAKRSELETKQVANKNKVAIIK